MQMLKSSSAKTKIAVAVAYLSIVETLIKAYNNQSLKIMLIIRNAF